jgi:hypothetical protein
VLFFKPYQELAEMKNRKTTRSIGKWTKGHGQFTE